MAVLPGDTVEVQTTSLRAPPQRPGALSAVALERVGATAIATAAQVTILGHGGPTPARVAQQLRQLLSATVSRALPEPEATLLLGVAFGIHSRIVGAVRTPLQDAGLIHVVAVSGLKVVMVAGLVESLARVRGWSRRRRTVATLATIGSYVVLSGAGAAALRSSLMVGAGLLLSRDGRRPHSFALLGLCAALLLAIEPAVATDVGFQLSFLGTAGILVLASPIAARVPGPRLLAEPFAVTIAAQLATAPVTAGTFGVLSLVGPFANALVLPLIPLVIVVGGAGALVGTVLPALAWAPLHTGGLSPARSCWRSRRGPPRCPWRRSTCSCGRRRGRVAEVAAAGAGGLAWFLHERWLAVPSGLGDGRGGGRGVAAGIATTSVAAATTVAPLRVTVLDVGNGVAVLVRPPGGGTVLVDGGADGAALLSALGRALSPLDRHLDAVVLTATDRATSAAIPSLVGHYDVGALLVSQPLPPALQTAATLLAGTGTRVIVAGASAWSVGGLSGALRRRRPAGRRRHVCCSSPTGARRRWSPATSPRPRRMSSPASPGRGSAPTCWSGPPRPRRPPTSWRPCSPPSSPSPPSAPRRASAASALEVAVTGRDSDIAYYGAARRRLRQRHRLTLGWRRLRAGRRRHRMAPAHNVVVPLRPRAAARPRRRAVPGGRAPSPAGARRRPGMSR